MKEKNESVAICGGKLENIKRDSLGNIRSKQLKDWTKEMAQLEKKYPEILIAVNSHFNKSPGSEITEVTKNSISFKSGNSSGTIYAEWSVQKEPKNPYEFPIHDYVAFDTAFDPVIKWISKREISYNSYDATIMPDWRLNYKVVPNWVGWCAPARPTFLSFLFLGFFCRGGYQSKNKIVKDSIRNHIKTHIRNIERQGARQVFFNYRSKGLIDSKIREEDIYKGY
jgi:hypothetical protein